MSGTTEKTILLAEDERSLRRAAEVALTRRGFRVITAVNGEEALQFAREHQPDLILLDLLMPKLTGMQVLEALRADAVTRGLRVLILSNSSRELEMEGADRLGVIDYWIKANVSLKELGDRVTAVLAS